MDSPQIFTNVPIDVLTDSIIEKLKPVVLAVVREQMPDEMITSMQAARILNVSTKTVVEYVKNGIIENIGTGIQRPKLSKKQVLEVKKLMSKGRFNPAKAGY